MTIKSDGVIADPVKTEGVVAYGVGQGAAAGAWTPADLFTGAEEGEWWLATSSGNLYQDVAKSTPVTTSGDVIGNMVGQRGSLDATQGTTAEKPTWIDLGGGTFGARLGVNTGDADSFDVTMPSALSSFTFGARARMNGTRIGVLLDIYLDASNRFQLYTSSGLYDIVAFSRVGGVNNTATLTPGAGDFTVILTHDAAAQSMVLYIGGASDTGAPAAGADYGTTVYLGRNATALSQGFHGGFYGGVLINKVISADERTELTTYLDGLS